MQTYNTTATTSATASTPPMTPPTTAPTLPLRDGERTDNGAVVSLECACTAVVVVVPALAVVIVDITVVEKVGHIAFGTHVHVPLPVAVLQFGELAISCHHQHCQASTNSSSTSYEAVSIHAIFIILK
jgi:hypothetical protein